MGLFSFSSSKEVSLIVDIGSSSVGASLVSIPKIDTEPPTIIGSIRTPLEFQEKLRFDRFISLMLDALEIAISNLIKNYKVEPKKIHCFVASPWYASRVRKAILKRDKDFVFDEEILKNILTEETKLFEKEEVATYERLKEQTFFLEKKVIDVMLNGYHVDNPIGVTTKSAELTLFLSIAPEYIIKKIEERIKKIIPSKIPSFHTFLLPFFLAIRDIFKDKKDFILMDIGGEITDITLIKNSVIKESISFPLGRNFIFRRGSEVLKKPREEIRSLLALGSQGKLDQNIKEKLLRSLLPVKQEWLSMLHESLSTLATRGIIPNDIFLATDSDVIKWFTDAITSEEYVQYHLSTDKFIVTPVNMPIISKHILFDTIDRDQFMALEAIYLGKYHTKI